MNLSGTSVATLAMLFGSLLLAVLVVAVVRPSPVEPPRTEIRAEHRTRPAPEPTAEPTAEPAPEKPEPKSQTAPPEAPEQPASPTASEPTPLAPPVETPAPEPVAPPVQTGGAPAGETGRPPGDTAAGDTSPAPRGIAAPTAEAAVARYYAALDERRFAAAWDALSPAVRSAFGTFEGWREGYANTISSTPSDLRVTSRPGGATLVEHILTAADRSSCGPVEQRFAVTWRLIEVDGAWLAERLTAKKRSGPAPATACA